MTNNDSSIHNDDILNHGIPNDGHTCKRRGRSLGFVAGAVFMGVLSAAAGAGAATLITSAQIKDSTIVGVDVKNSSLTGADVKNSSIGGKDVKNGSLTAGDLSAGARAGLIDGSIPSGTTVTGTVYFDSNSTASGDFGVTVSLPGKASEALTSAKVNFGGGSTNPKIADEDTVGNCTGSANAPMAPAGEVCLYLVTTSSDSNEIRGSETYQKPSQREFAVRWFDTSVDSDDVFITAVWAYTAP